MAARKRIARNAAPLDVEQFPGYDPLVTAADRRPSLPEALDALRLLESGVSRWDGRGTPHDARQ